MATLSGCATRDIREEIGVLASLSGELEEGREKDRIRKETLRLLNKLAHKKYRAQFAEALSALRSASRGGLGGGPTFIAGLDRIEERAGRRMADSPGTE